MAITKITMPTAGTPSVSTDYNLQNFLIASLVKQGLKGPKLTGWDSAENLPALALGVYIRHQNFMYIVDTAAYTILGSTAAGKNYIKLSGTGTTITATWTQSKTGFAYDSVKCGYYDSGGDQILMEYMYYAALEYLNYVMPVQQHDAVERYKWGQSGSGLEIPASGRLAITALNSTDVAFFNDINDELRTYRRSSSAWSLVGSGLEISGADSSALTALSSTDVAFIDRNNEELRTYRWSGSVWSFVGSGLSISITSQYLALTALNSTDVAFIDGTNKELRTYRWSGSVWSLVGSELSISGVYRPALTALNSTDVAFIDAFNKELRTYRWSGSAWSLVGSGLSISGGLDYLAFTALNSIDVAFIDQSNDELRTYRWSGSVWSLVDSGLSISAAASSVALAALNSTDVAYIDNNNEELRIYVKIPNTD